MQKDITHNTCRVCLKDHEILISLFDEVEDFDNLKLSELLESFGDVKIDSTDIYPKYICNECTTELLITAKFRQKCQKTEEILSHFVSDGTCEDEDIIDEIVQCDDDDNANSNSSFIENSLTNNEINIKDEKEFIKEKNQINSPKLFYDDGYIEENSHHNVNDEEEDEQSENEVQEDNTSYIIFDSDELGDDIIAEIQSSALEKSSDVIQKISDDQILYDRIVNAANAAVVKKFSRKTITKTKPQIINCNCDVCGAGFTYLSSLRKHLETHGFKEIYECTICLWPFNEIDKLELHCLLEHPQVLNNDDKGDNTTEMNEDENVKETDNNTQLNVKNKNTANVKYDFENNQKETRRCHTCDRCHKTFVSKSALVAHVRIHTGDRPFKCSECSKTFTTQGGLALHTRRHTGYRPFLCTICNKRFVESSNLKVHMRIHTGEKPHKCTVCGRGFSRVFLLQLHQRTHTGEKPYQCPYCNKAFAQQGDLCTHKRIHTGERPHQCPHCDKSFIKSSALNVHVRKHMKLARIQLKSSSVRNTNMTAEDNDDSQDQECDLDNALNPLNHEDESIQMATVSQVKIIGTELITESDDVQDIDENKICVIDDLDSIMVDIESRE